MNIRSKILSSIAAIAITTGSAYAMNPEVGGAPMLSDKNIVENAVNSKDHTTLVAAVKAAGLVDTLMSEGPFTVFAPINEGFAELPEGTVETLLKPENKDALTKVLTSHVVAGKIKAADVIALAEANGGKAEVTTLSGAKLKAKVKNGGVYIKDESGNWGQVTTADVTRSNGVVHIVNQVLLPNSDGNS